MKFRNLVLLEILLMVAFSRALFISIVVDFDNLCAFIGWYDQSTIKTLQFDWYKTRLWHSMNFQMIAFQMESEKVNLRISLVLGSSASNWFSPPTYFFFRPLRSAICNRFQMHGLFVLQRATSVITKLKKVFWFICCCILLRVQYGSLSAHWWAHVRTKVCCQYRDFFRGIHPLLQVPYTLFLGADRFIPLLC